MSNKLSSRALGAVSESVVAKYLQKRGYQLVSQNAHMRVGEIDLILKDADVLVFVEVKSSATHLNPVINMTNVKQDKLRKAVQKWLLFNNRQRFEYRVDYVGVIWKQGRIRKIEHIQNAVHNL